MMVDENDYKVLVNEKHLLVVEHLDNDYYVVVNHMVDLMKMMMVVVEEDDHMVEKEVVVDVFDQHLNKQICK